MNYIDIVLDKLYMESEFHYTTFEQRASQRDAYYAIAWYITTGRATTAWIKAVGKANPRKLIAYILKQEDQSVSAQVNATTTYIRRYCGFAY